MNDIRNLYKMVVALENDQDENVMRVNDAFDIEFNDTFVIETSISGFTEDGIIIECDEKMLELLEINDILVEGVNDEALQEDLRKKLAAAGLAGALAVGGGAALDATSAKNSPLGKELEAAAQAGDDVAAYHYKKLDLYAQEDLRTLINLKIAYLDDSNREDVKDYLAKTAKLDEGKDYKAVEDGDGRYSIYTVGETGGKQDLVGQKYQGLTKSQAKKAIDKLYAKDMGTLDEEQIDEAVYQGRKVKLNKPMQGDVAKFKVYVNSGKKTKDGEIKAKKVNFGSKDMRIKKSNPERRKSFRARHKCDTAKDKTTARYWSCRKW